MTIATLVEQSLQGGAGGRELCVLRGELVGWVPYGERNV